MKYLIQVRFSVLVSVVPLVGTWIEILILYLYELSAFVVPLVGTWIEICLDTTPHGSVLRSSPSWGRGLKFCFPNTLRNVVIVVPLVGTWIEIF